MAVVLLLVVVAVALVALGPSHRRAFDETERFHRAAHLTSSWARAGVTRPVLDSADDEARDRPREPSEV